MKLIIVDVKGALLNAGCDEEELVESPKEFGRHGNDARLRIWLCDIRKVARSGKTTTQESWCQTG